VAWDQANRQPCSGSEPPQLQAHLPSPSWHRTSEGGDGGVGGDELFSLVRLEIVYFHLILCGEWETKP
jgi:hypothetical protein